jgi:hypothetical protein
MFQPRLRLPGPYGRLSLSVLLSLLAACGGSSGGAGPALAIDEDETVANDTPATANALKLNQPIRGEVSVAGDVDCFSIALTAGKIVRIEVFGTRNDQDGWDTNQNIPRLTVLDTDANANAKLLEHDYSGNFSDGWSQGFHDLDIPMFEVPATGTYFVAVTQDDQALGGGAYILRVSTVPAPGLQQETEAAGVSGDNDDSTTAEAIHPGVMHGFHVADELDYYKFTVGGPTVVRFEMNAYRNGVHNDSGLYYDTYVYLYDTDGATELTSNDDTYFYDSAIQYEIDTPGTYYFAVDQYASAEGDYFLTYSTSAASGTLESEPNDDAATADTIAYGQRRRGSLDVGESDVYSFPGKAGDMLRLQVFDSDNKQDALSVVSASLVGSDGLTDLSWGGDAGFQTLTTILQATGTYYVRVDGAGALTDYAIALTRFESSDYETEPNDTDVDAGTLTTRVSGVIDPGGDADMFSVSLKKDELVRFVCYASSVPTDSDGCEEYSGHGSSLSPLIELLDDVGTVVAASTSEPTNGSYTESVTQPLPTCGLVTTASVAGTYFVRITDAAALSGATYYYVLEYERH